LRSMIQESLKEMRELGGRLIARERIRHRLRRENAPRETFHDLDKPHRADLAFLKIHHRHFAIGIALAFFLIVLGIFCGVIATVSFRDENLTVGLITAVCSISILYAGKKQIFG
jgi:hypothetical protein